MSSPVAVFKTYTLAVNAVTTTSDPRLILRSYTLGDYYVQVAAVVTGTVNFTIQYSYDVGTLTNWLSLSDVTAATANADTRITSPVTAIRAVQNSGSGSVAVILTQVFPGFGGPTCAV